MSHADPCSGSTDERFYRPLIDAFDELSSSCPGTADQHGLLGRVAALAVASVPACDEASVSIRNQRGVVETPCATAPAIVDLDAEQFRAGAGPCLSAVTGTDPTAYSADVARDGRWPEFGRSAAERGFGSVFSRRFDAGGPVGGVNFYARRTNAFNDDDKAVATLLAQFAGAAAGLACERSEAMNLREALLSRDVIGQAKGILMEREKVTSEEAFQLLRVASQHLNRKVRDLAEEVATTGEMPTARR